MRALSIAAVAVFQAAIATSVSAGACVSYIPRFTQSSPDQLVTCNDGSFVYSTIHNSASAGHYWELQAPVNPYFPAYRNTTGLTMTCQVLIASNSEHTYSASFGCQGLDGSTHYTSIYASDFGDFVGVRARNCSPDLKWVGLRITNSNVIESASLYGISIQCTNSITSDGDSHRDRDMLLTVREVENDFGVRVNQTMVVPRSQPQADLNATVGMNSKSKLVPLVPAPESIRDATTPTPAPTKTAYPVNSCNTDAWMEESCTEMSYGVDWAHKFSAGSTWYHSIHVPTEAAETVVCRILVATDISTSHSGTVTCPDGSYYGITLEDYNAFVPIYCSSEGYATINIKVENDNWVSSFTIRMSAAVCYID